MLKLVVNMLKLNEIVVYDLEYVTIIGLRLWFYNSYLDTKVIAKIAKIRMSLN